VEKKPNLNNYLQAVGKREKRHENGTGGVEEKRGLTRYADSPSREAACRGYNLSINLNEKNWGKKRRRGPFLKK